jgi:hypothetical protein
MTRAREQQICCEDTPYYHCISIESAKHFFAGSIDLLNKILNIEGNGLLIGCLKLARCFALIFALTPSCQITVIF